MSGCQMVPLSNGGLKTRQKMSVYILDSNVGHLNGPPNHVIRPFESQTEKVSEKSNVQISDVPYSDGY